MAEKTVTVNGIVYDSRTGMPLHQERSHSNAHHPAQAIHVQPQKSRTLHRRYVSHDAPKLHAEPQPEQAVIQPRKAPPAPLVTRSESIVRFAKQSVATVPQGKVIKDIGPTQHHLVHRVEARTVAPAKPAVKPSQIIKQEAIAKAMANSPAKRAKDVIQPKKSKSGRFIKMASVSLSILLLGGYLTYINMPALSTRVAANQAGINAEYPGYHPTGYSLSGPVAYDHGSVTMKFAANAGPQNYTLTQAKSGWDSSAVLDNYVAPKVGEQYSTTNANGLTIYTFANSAAWVNAGILYTISGNAPLSNEQVQRIATSL